MMLDKIAEMEQRLLDIEMLMADPEVATDSARLMALGKERSSLEPVVASYRAYQQTEQALREAQAIVQEAGDADLVALAQEEIATLEERQATLEEELKLAMSPKDPTDDRNVFVEIRAAAGGEEAALFAAELYRMYTRYAQNRSWEVELIDSRETGIGGFKEIVFEVKGRGAYSRLKHESGGHRVQRVPATESSGRLHTSTVTVAVIPEAEDVEVDLRDEDIRIDVFHAGGHGGQNVNKVATAVRITHLPTGIVAVCQDERSQLRNKQKAMAVVKARLLDRVTQEQQQGISQNRRLQVGTGERSEKVRTYNFPQDRVTDHRINLTLHNIPGIIDGGLDPLVEPLMARGAGATDGGICGMTATIGDATLQTRRALEQGGVSEAPLEAELLVAMTLGISRSRLYASLPDEFQGSCRQPLKELIRRRLLREPIAYLLGKREFYGLELAVGPGVFVPRPETELLVEQAIYVVEARFPKGNAIIADVGTGSGAVAVSLAANLPDSYLYATDVSQTALATAQSNAEGHKVRQRIDFQLGDLLEPLTSPVDIVVANLPYISSDAIPTLEPEISRFEPREALDGGHDGLDLVRRLLHQAPKHLGPAATILLELDPDQMNAASSTALEVFPEARLRLFKDLAGLERVLAVQC